MSSRLAVGSGRLGGIGQGGRFAPWKGKGGLYKVLTALPAPRLGAVREHQESRQHLGLRPAAEGHRQPAGTVPPLPGAGAVRRGWAGADTGLQESPGRTGPGGPRAGQAGQGSPRTGPEARERVAWRHPSPVMTGGQGGPGSGTSRGPRPRSGGQRGPGVSGRAERLLSLCSIESSPQQDLPRFSASWLCCPAFSGPGVCFHGGLSVCTPAAGAGPLPGGAAGGRRWGAVAAFFPQPVR